MKIELIENVDNLQLLRAIGSKDAVVSANALSTFAALMKPVLNTVYQQADTTKFIYKDYTYREDEDPSLPLDLYADVPEGHFSVWSNAMPGGLATNHVYQPIEEVKFSTYRIDSAISILKKYARQARLPIWAKSMERLLQEVLVRTNYSAWSVILGALSQARHNIGGTVLPHVFRSANSGQFSFDDFNKFITYFKRLNAAWTGGTPTVQNSRPTDFVMSPEMMEKIRSFAYNPINTKGGNTTSIGAASDASSAATVALPDAQRSDLFSSGGVPNFFGIDLIELFELGKNQDYQTLFAQYQGATQFPIIGTTTSDQSFAASTNELIIALNANREGAVRVIEQSVDEDGIGAGVFELQADDQFVKRAEKVGLYGGIREGRAVIDSRFVAALVV